MVTKSRPSNQPDSPLLKAKNGYVLHNAEVYHLFERTLHFSEKHVPLYLGINLLCQKKLQISCTSNVQEIGCQNSTTDYVAVQYFIVFKLDNRDYFKT